MVKDSQPKAKRNDSRISTFITLKVLNVEIRESFRFAFSCECLTCTCIYSFISNNYLPDVAVAYSKCYPQLLGNGKLCLETGGADLQCILSLFCSPNRSFSLSRNKKINQKLSSA